MTTIELIRSLIKKDLEQGMKKIEITRKVGVSYTTLWSYMNSDVTPDFETIKLFSKAYGLPLDYFMEGAPPTPPAHTPPPLLPYGAGTAGTLPVLVMHETSARSFYSELGTSSTDGAREGAIEAGKRVLRPVDVVDRDAYGVEVRGDEMSPRFEDGEIVIASPAAPVKNRDYAVTVIGTEAVVRRIRFSGDLVILEPINPNYEPVISQKEEVPFVHKVVWAKLR